MAKHLQPEALEGGAGEGVLGVARVNVEGGASVGVVLGEEAFVLPACKSFSEGALRGGQDSTPLAAQKGTQ